MPFSIANKNAPVRVTSNGHRWATLDDRQSQRFEGTRAGTLLFGIGYRGAS